MIDETSRIGAFRHIVYRTVDRSAAPDFLAAQHFPSRSPRLPGAISLIVPFDVGTWLADYAYLGERSFVTSDLAQPDVKWTLASLTGTNDPDTGDIYSGLDRFGRVKDNRWYDYGASADADRIRRTQNLGRRRLTPATVRWGFPTPISWGGRVACRTRPPG